MHHDPTTRVTFVVQTAAPEVQYEIEDLARIDLKAAGVPLCDIRVSYDDHEMDIACRSIEADRVIYRLLRARADDPGGDIVQVESLRMTDQGWNAWIVFPRGQGLPQRPNRFK
jgi:hypothetical protein